MGLNSVKRRKDKDLIYSLQSPRIGIFPSQCYNIVGMPIPLLRPQHTRALRVTSIDLVVIRHMLVAAAHPRATSDILCERVAAQASADRKRGAVSPSASCPLARAPMRDISQRREGYQLGGLRDISQHPRGISLTEARDKAEQHTQQAVGTALALWQDIERFLVALYNELTSIMHALHKAIMI